MTEVLITLLAAAAVLYGTWRIETVLGQFEVEPKPSRYQPSREESEQLAKTTLCTHCGGFHSRACPRVARIVFEADGATIREVRFWREFDESGIVWPDELDLSDEEPLQGEVVPAGARSYHAV